MSGSTVTKNCTKCRAEKALDEFHRCRAAADGRQWYCKDCVAGPRKYRPTFEERFWSHVDKNGPVHPVLGTECWDWTGYTGPFGYGQLGVSRPRRLEAAHRVSWTLAKEDPGELCVLHRCDRPSCVRPDHLFLGDRTENMRDKVRKGRQHRGESHPGAKLTDAKVQQLWKLRESGLSYRVIAETLGVAGSLVEQVIRGRTWKHVPH